LLSIGDSISVYLTDDFGRICYDTITINYNGSVNIAITYPVTNLMHHDTCVSPIFVRGTTSASDGNSVYIYKNNVLQCTALVVSFTWEGTASLSGIGDSISAKIIDEFMNVAWDTITVNYDTIAPSKPMGLITIADVDLPNTGVVLIWNVNIETDSIGYNIYRDTTGLGYYIKINSSIITNLTYYDTLAVQGDTQFYAITCVDSYGNESVYSDSSGAGNLILTKSVNSVSLGGSVSIPRPGSTIEYYIVYFNNGFAPITNVIITDSVFVSRVEFKTGSADTVAGNNQFAIITFSSDNGNSYVYNPSGLVDTNVTNIKWEIQGFVYPDLSGVSGRIKLGVVVK
ncbi:MAG TPA: hypothetical protein PKY81_17605, partial [bacterium]|nr:hypothetical protein [bacterium]